MSSTRSVPNVKDERHNEGKENILALAPGAELLGSLA